jgi:glyoxylase-like metal-dependent hydrolase (beta-lactamase superfamily II)
MHHEFPVLHNIKDYGEGDTIMVGDLAVKVLHTPGHSEGCVVLQCEDVLFTGDTLFAGSMGRTDFPGGSTKKIMKSLKRLAELEGNFAVLPGHMETSNLETERQRNPYMIQAMRY